LVKDGDDSFGLVFSLTGNTEVAHRGRELRLGRGDGTFLHVCNTGTFGSRADFQFLNALVTPSDIAARGARLDNAVMKRLPRQSEGVQLLRGYIRSLEGIAPALSTDGRRIIRSHVVDLIVLAATAQHTIGESSASAVMAARLRAALAYIAAHFNDPGLSLESVARSQRISSRYLQRLMESVGTSFTAHVNTLRLQKAFALLTEAGRMGRISDVALEVGFSGISHFNRLFRAHFGDTPSGIRRTADIV